LAGIAYSVII